MPLVSVVLNSYNQKAYLPEAVESVLGQTYRDFELVVVDNGSNDGSQELLQRYTDPRIRLFLHPENISVSRRMNEGVTAAKGDLVSFLYSDDYYLPEKLARQVELFEGLSADYGVVYGPGYGFNQLTKGRWTYPSLTHSGTMLPALFTDHSQGSINMISPMIRRECLIRHPFCEEVFAEGEAVLYRIATTHKFHFAPEPLVVMRDHGRNAGKAVRRNLEMVLVSLASLERDPAFPQDQRADLNKFRARLIRDHGWCVLRLGGDASWARSQLLRAARLSPQVAAHPRVVAGLALSFVPSSVRAPLNRVGSWVRKRPSNQNLVQDYK